VVAVPWLQPYPDRLWEPAAAPEAEPEAVLIRRETIELAFLAALQHLPPRQRAVLVLRDVLGWSAADTAAALDTTAAAVNSALQRARPAVRELLPERREEWPSGPVADRAERELLERWVAAIEEADDDALRALLREDARVAHQAGAGGHTGAEPTWYAGRERILAAWAPLLHPAEPLAVRALPTWVNRQPALGTYVGLPGSVERVGIGLTVLTLAGGQVSEVASFDAALLPACGLPARL
jgi:RNA polymerase sigma-70 factor (ECF subfamily)